MATNSRPQLKKIPPTPNNKSKTYSNNESSEDAAPINPEPTKPKEKTLWEIVNEAKDSDLEGLFLSRITKVLNASTLAKEYHVLMLYSDDTSIRRYTTDRIYSTLRTIAKNKDKPILLIILSNGGSVESAYLISKACKEYAKDKFIVAIPRHAKSAATLLALGADEIHMGIMSELGPIDPQINGVPALALKHALENVSELCEKYPKASTMFSSYLAKTLKITELGYYERICKSAAQYAELLLKRRFPAKGAAGRIANNLVYEFKDHGFVIDHDEAVRFFGSEFVKYNTDESQLAEKLHEVIEEFDLCLRILKKQKIRWILGRLDTPSIYMKALEGE